MRPWPGWNIMQSTHRYGSSFNQECDEPVNTFDAVNKAYADRIKYKQLLLIFLILLWQTIHSSHFPLRNLFQWKDKNMWDVGWTVGRWVDCNIKSNVRNFVAWISQVFQRSVASDILHWFPCQWLDSQFSPRLHKTTVRQFINLQPWYKKYILFHF